MWLAVMALFENGFDNWPFEANQSQADSDGDGVGDACEVAACPSECASQR